MNKNQTFLIRAELGNSGVLKECVMRLPVNQHGGITTKGHKIIASRFFDGDTQTPGRMQYAINLEDFSSGADLIEVITKYQKNVV